MKLLVKVQEAFNPLSILTRRAAGQGIVSKQQKILCKCNYVNLLSVYTQRGKYLLTQLNILLV